MLTRCQIHRRLDIMNALVCSQDWRRQLSPKLIWLEPEHFAEAKKISFQNLEEAHQWKLYLNALALFGFDQWLLETSPNIYHHQDSFSILKQNLSNISDVVGKVKLGNFNLYLIAVDDLNDEFISIPKAVINSPELAAHFYVLIEVLAEEEQLNIYGFLRHDQIVKYCNLSDCISQNNSSYLIQLKLFDRELNNLLLSARFLEVSAIPLPSAFNINHIQNTASKKIVKLTDWLNGVFAEGWQATEIIWQTLPINLDAGFARSVNKSNSYEISGAKLFDFGIQLNSDSFALVVNQKNEVNNDKDILVQILPSNHQHLPLGLQLTVTLNPNTPESESQTVTARSNDNAIQLEFIESPGKKFKVEISFNDAVVTEEFVL